MRWWPSDNSGVCSISWVAGDSALYYDYHHPVGSQACLEKSSLADIRLAHFFFLVAEVTKITFRVG